MKWTPSFKIEPIGSEEPQKRELKQKMVSMVDDIYNLPRSPVSDTTRFIVESTSVDTNKLADPRFKMRNELFILAIDKFSALSNLKPVDQTITQLIWQDLLFAIKFGYWKRAERKALELIRFYNESRGREGKFSGQLITTREELVAESKKTEEESKKKGFWSLKKPRSEVVDEGVDGDFTR
jgi:hypothetical protein